TGDLLWNNGSDDEQIVIKAFTTAPLNYTVTLTDANGCKAKASVSVTVSGCVGLSEEAAADLISIYPNPSNGSFVVEVGASLNITILNELGQVVKTFSADQVPDSGKLQVEGLSKGLYLIQASDEERSFNSRIVIE